MALWFASRCAPPSMDVTSLFSLILPAPRHFFFLFLSSCITADGALSLGFFYLDFSRDWMDYILPRKTPPHIIIIIKHYPPNHQYPPPPPSRPPNIHPSIHFLFTTSCMYYPALDQTGYDSSHHYNGGKKSRRTSIDIICFSRSFVPVISSRYDAW